MPRRGPGGWYRRGTASGCALILGCWRAPHELFACRRYERGSARTDRERALGRQTGASADAQNIEQLAVVLDETDSGRSPEALLGPPGGTVPSAW